MARIVAAVVLILTTTAVIGPNPVEAQEPRPLLKVVQLGDSYSAGNGARNAGGGRNYVGVEGCYRSPTNWGSQFLATLSGTFDITYINRACSGGVIGDITSRREISSRRVGQLIGCPGPEYPDEESWERDNGFPLDTCRRYLRPQIDAVDESVDLVLMTGGGNDAEFAKVVEQCFVVGLRDPGDCREAVEFATDQLPAIEERLVSTFAELRADMRPEARIIFVTYPHLVGDNNFRLTSLLGTDTYLAGNAIRALAADGDERQRNAVARANAAAGEDFIILVDDIKELFEGREPNPAAFSSNPDRWLYEIAETRIKEEWYHYNPSGHSQIGNLIASRGPFGVGTNPLASPADIDVAFIVDTTGSMGDEIAEVRTNLSNIVAQLDASTNSFRVSVVSYRDFPERTGSSVDYPSRLDLDFSSDVGAIQAAIDSLTANGGGDGPETVFSGISTSLDLTWRAGVTKIAIVIGDAPPLGPPEPISGLTPTDLILRSLAIDPVEVIGVDVGVLSSGGALAEIADGTGGSIVNGSAGLVEAINQIIEETANQPFAWMGTAYSGPIGSAVTFDGSGSYDPSGTPLSLYEWDFDGDGIFDASTTTPQVTHTYPAAFTGYAVLRVTGAGGTALASARVVVNELGYAPQGDDEPCPFDDDGYPILTDDEGRWLACSLDSLPTEEAEGVVAEIDDLTSICSTIEPTIVGTEGDDIIRGTSGDDVIFALGGDDEVAGGSGDDIICLGSGDDIARGDAGADQIYGGDGADEVDGGNADDLLDGESGDDTIEGGNGRDALLGGPGNDELGAGNGDDIADGGAGDDAIDGGRGDDALDGGDGTDSIDGGRGRDTCSNGETTTACEL